DPGRRRVPGRPALRRVARHADGDHTDRSRARRLPPAHTIGGACDTGPADAVSCRGPHERSISSRLGLTHATEEGTAAGIHGVIVSAAVMAASHVGSAVALVMAVLVTLLIYWGA